MDKGRTLTLVRASDWRTQSTLRCIAVVPKSSVARQSSAALCLLVGFLSSTCGTRVTYSSTRVPSKSMRCSSPLSSTRMLSMHTLRESTTSVVRLTAYNSTRTPATRDSTAASQSTARQCELRNSQAMLQCYRLLRTVWLLCDSIHSACNSVVAHV